jgi:hypothetical protein
MIDANHAAINDDHRVAHGSFPFVAKEALVHVLPHCIPFLGQDSKPVDIDEPVTVLVLTPKDTFLSESEFLVHLDDSRVESQNLAVQFIQSQGSEGMIQHQEFEAASRTTWCIG